MAAHYTGVPIYVATLWQALVFKEMPPSVWDYPEEKVRRELFFIGEPFTGSDDSQMALAQAIRLFPNEKDIGVVKRKGPPRPSVWQQLIESDL